MGLPRAMVDRARVVYTVEDPAQTVQAPSGVTVWPGGNGQPASGTGVGPWFKCRLTVNQPRESGGGNYGSRGYRFLEGDAELMMLTTAEDGTSLTDADGRFTALQDADRVEVQSAADPGRMWFVHTGVVPMRKRERVVGWRVGLRKARETKVRQQTLPAGSVALGAEETVAALEDAEPGT